MNNEFCHFHHRSVNPRTFFQPQNRNLEFVLQLAKQVTARTRTRPQIAITAVGYNDESAPLMLSFSNKESCNCQGHSIPCFRYCVVPIWSEEWRAFGIHNPYTNQSYIHLTEISQIALARTEQVFLQRSGQVILWLLALLI